jgi:phosphatidylethanolamine/phosphatidyl-N-methylethanolamine N-methyltransferase
MKDSLLFLGQAARRWRVTGTVTPSGRPLARAIVDGVGPIPDGGVILELGPGTGVVTRELVSRFPRARVVAVEVLDAFADRLSGEFPEVAVVRGCASHLTDHLTKHDISPGEVSAVISGLPLLSLPDDLPQRILTSIKSVLRPGRRYVQFTYSARAWRRFDVAGFDRLGTRRVWRNLPPAFVLMFERTGPDA